MVEDKFNPVQIEGYRAMSGEERLRIAFGLSALVRDIARAGIKQQNPSFTPEEVELELQRRIEYGRTRIPCPRCGKIQQT